MTDLLLKDGRCDPTIVNNNGDTAIKIAVEKREHVRIIVELLLSDTRVVKALRAEDGVSPAAAIARAVARKLAPPRIRGARTRRVRRVGVAAD